MDEIIGFCGFPSEDNKFNLPNVCLILGKALESDGQNITQTEIYDLYLDVVMSIPYELSEAAKITTLFIVFADWLVLIANRLGFVIKENEENSWLRHCPQAEKLLNKISLSCVKYIATENAAATTFGFSTGDVLVYMEQNKVSLNEAVITLRRESIKLVK